MAGRIRKGHLTVSHKGGAADTVVRLSRRLFEGMASGETNILSAMLRGEVVLEGDYRLMIMLRRHHSEASGGSSARAGRRLCEEAGMSDGLVKILDGNTFVVSDERGDIEASLTDPTGLFSFDTRFLSSGS